jgi:two-component system KDP operon response regulator KdpE
MDGTAVIRSLRGWSDVPIIVLSGRTDPAIMADALDIGADDYVIKPFLMDELNARIRAALRRSQPSSPPSRRIHRIGDWLIDIEARVVTAFLEGSGAAAPHLTPKEWRLLDTLLERPGTLVESGQLLTAVWGPGHEHSTNYLRTYFRQLRSKLEPEPSQPRHLITEPGLGHRYLP